MTDPGAMTHAWLLTGPPGSGRSVAARAFAAALECPDGGCGQCRECRTAVDATHADVDGPRDRGPVHQGLAGARPRRRWRRTRPSVGAWRVIIIEDADRLTERAADSLLKALEEPVARTVWILCAPSLEDVIITIRSRSRHVRLRTPPPEAVAELLVRRDGIEPAMAMYAARAAQSHVGLARRLARDEGARIRRRDVIALAGQIRGVGHAVNAAADLAAIADEESSASSTERDAAERAAAARDARRRPAARTQPPHVRCQIAALESEQKARATRHSRDVLDRSLVDLLSVYRDALVCTAAPGSAWSTRTASATCSALAEVHEPRAAAQAMDAIGTARERIGLNVAPLLALEAMAISLRVPR